MNHFEIVISLTRGAGKDLLLDRKYSRLDVGAFQPGNQTIMWLMARKTIEGKFLKSPEPIWRARIYELRDDGSEADDVVLEVPKDSEGESSVRLTISNYSEWQGDWEGTMRIVVQKEDR